MTSAASSSSSRWPVLSPLLDELLDLEEPGRTRRLVEIRTQDPGLAAELQTLLDKLPRIERDRFLEEPAMPPPVTLAGRVIGPYTIERELGEGGMGSVWLARRSDGRYDAQVAVKFLHGGLTGRAAAERFAREGNILGRLSHPHIARLLDAGVLDGTQPYLVLEYIDGLPLDQHCDTLGLDLERRLKLFLDVLGAVAHAHNRLILHRDIKPSNILVTAEGEVKLLDFGIAKLLDDNEGAGQVTELTRRAGRAYTPHYAAPEQVQGGDVTTATDVYSLGVLLYGLLAGEHPTSPLPTAPLEEMRALVELEPPKVSDVVARRGNDGDARRARELRGDLDNILAKALKKAPSERYANAAAFADDLRRYLAHEPVQARPDSASYRVAKFLRRHALAMGAAFVTIAALGVGAGVALWQAREAQRQQAQAEGLIEFMLGDLRKKLQPVGRLDVLDAVGEKVLAYYGKEDPRALGVDELARQARALHLLGEITEQRGQLDEAARIFERAAASTEALLNRAPMQFQRVFDHAQSVYWQGYIHWRMKRLPAAQSAFEQYRELAHRLVAIRPDSAEARTEMAAAGNNLAVLYMEIGKDDLALQNLEEVRRTWTDLARSRPELHYELANTWGWMARARENLGDYQAAIAAQQHKVDSLRQVPDGSNSSSVQRLLSDANYEISRMELALGRGGPALKHGQLALAGIERLVALDPSNRSRAEEAAFYRLLVAAALHAVGRRQEATAELQLALQGVRQLQAYSPPSGGAASAAPVSLLADSIVETQRLAPQLLQDPEFEQWLQRVETEIGANVPAAERVRVAAVRAAAGDRREAAGQLTAARQHWSAALSLLEDGAAPATPPRFALQAALHLKLGDAPRARAYSLTLKNSSFRHPAYADLLQRLNSEAVTFDAKTR